MNASPSCEFIGYYSWTWSHCPPTPPSNVNLGIAFSGWTDIANALSQSNKIRDRLQGRKSLTLGGGNQNGSWSQQALASVDNAIKADMFAEYAAITFDVELGDSGLAGEFASVFSSARGKGFLVVVTVSHSAPFGFADGATLMNAFFADANIDVLSPQLYTTGEETKNDFAISHGVAWKTYAGAKAAIAPSIVRADMYEDARTFFAGNGVDLRGFIQWAQT